MPTISNFISGDTVRFSVTFSVSSVNTDPTTVTFRTRNANRVVRSFTYLTDAEVVRSAVGQYRIDLQLDLPGEHWFRWESSGIAPGASEDRVKILRSQIIG